jgi:hypothetical protein
VIPAYSLLSDEQEGLNRFAASVKDIKLFLRTDLELRELKTQPPWNSGPIRETAWRWVPRFISHFRRSYKF